MGRKRRFSKLLLFTVMLATIGAGVFGSMPLPVKAAEGEEYTVTFEAYEGSCETESISVAKGESLTLPDASYEGHYLEAWVDITTDEGVTKFKPVGMPGSEYTPEKNMWLYALWKPEKAQEITVSFDACGGDSQESITVESGTALTLPGATRDGYTFTGWYKDEALTEYVGAAGDEYIPDDDGMLYAGWEKAEAYITYDADGGEMEGGDITVKVGDTITLPACTKEGYDFTGWFNSDVCIGQAGEQYDVSGDVTLKAHYEKKMPEIITITFNTDGGKEAKSVSAVKGDTIRLPKTEKEGYSFLGWYTEKDGGILLGIPGSAMKAVKDMTAYALWEKETEKDADNDADPENCKVTFHAGKGTIKVKELTIIKNGSFYLPMPEREGYDFSGWYLDDDLTQFAGAYHDTYRITRDTDFYAKWEKSKGNNTGDESSNGDNSSETLNTYTIKYDANCGKTKNASVKVVKGGSVKLPGAEREGYIFKGWYTDRQVFIGTKGENYKPSRSISLYARWEKEDKDDQDNNTENTNDKDNKNTSDKNKNTSGTVSGNSAGSPSDKDTDIKTEGGNENAGKGTEPVIQTGHASPYYLLAALGLCGVMLTAASVLEGKKGEKSCL